MGLLAGLTVPLVTPMSAPSVPTSADHFLAALAAGGARGLMLFGSNGEGPLLPVSVLGEFASWAATRWRELTGGPVLCNVTAAGTAEVLERAAAVAKARPDALVLSPPIYFRHRDDEILAHYQALSDFPVVVYNAPRYSNPLSRDLAVELMGLPHVVGIKDSSGDLDFLAHLVKASDVEVSQGTETQLLTALRAGAHGVVPGVANLVPQLVSDLIAAHEDGRDADAEAAQQAVDRVFALHTVRPGVPSVKAILDDRGLCPPHVAAPLQPCTDTECAALLAALSADEHHLLPRR
jgi:4-hydroxy-tetrahydrodipicolinate synthase